MPRALPFALLVLVGLGSLAFDLTLSARLPSEADWAEVAGALRARTRTGDAVQIWPPWAERARLYVDAVPVLAEEDLAAADYAGVQRLWLVALPRVPHAGLSQARAALLKRSAQPAGGAQDFGAILLEPWDLRARPLAQDLTPREEHEVDYIARRCQRVPVGGSLGFHAVQGALLHVRAGIIGERAYDADKPPIVAQIFADGRRLGGFEIAGAGYRGVDVALGAEIAAGSAGAAGSARDGSVRDGSARDGSVRDASASEISIAISSADLDRPFCVQAWTTR